MIVLKEFELTRRITCRNITASAKGCTDILINWWLRYRARPTMKAWLLNFIRLKNIVKENVLVHLDHACINDILPQPSAENISIWVWNKLKDLLHGDNYDLYEVEVWETKTSGCIYRGDL